jgi:membrane associated rhomboid family serine protease
VSSPAPGFAERAKEALAKLRRPPAPATSSSEPGFDPTSWSGAIVVMVIFGVALWVVQIVNAADNQHLNRFGLKPRSVDGLWGILTQPFLHQGYSGLLSDTVAVVAIGWVLLLSGVRVWLFVTAAVVIVGGAATWLVAPSVAHGGRAIVGSTGLVFGWMGYLLARAYFSRKIKWILTAVVLLLFFGTLLGSLVPSGNSHGSWQSRTCGFVVGAFIGWLLHPRGRRNTSGASRSRPAVS